MDIQVSSERQRDARCGSCFQCTVENLVVGTNFPFVGNQPSGDLSLGTWQYVDGGKYSLIIVILECAHGNIIQQETIHCVIYKGPKTTPFNVGSWLGKNKGL